MKEYRAALTLQPRAEGVHQAIGRVLWAQGKMPEAAAEFEQELQIQPQDPESHFYLGQYWIASNRPLEAREHLEAASRWTKDSPDPAIALARLYLGLNELAKAEQAAARALDLAPRSEQAQNLLRQVREKAKK